MAAGRKFNVPLRPMLTAAAPAAAQASFFAVDQPNVQIVTVKTLTENVIRGEVSSAPLNPTVNKIFVIRLQEFAGRGGAVRVSVPVKIKSATLMNLTESVEIARISEIAPLTVSLKPFEAATVRIETE